MMLAFPRRDAVRGGDKAGPDGLWTHRGDVMHTFKNTGPVTATIVEVFGKATK